MKKSSILAMFFFLLFTNFAFAEDVMLEDVKTKHQSECEKILKDFLALFRSSQEGVQSGSNSSFPAFYFNLENGDLVYGSVNVNAPYISLKISPKNNLDTEYLIEDSDMDGVVDVAQISEKKTGKTSKVMSYSISGPECENSGLEHQDFWQDTYVSLLRNFMKILKE